MSAPEPDRGLPIYFGPVSNGEYEPEQPDAIQMRAISTATDEIDAAARLTGMTRRRFLRSACAMAITLLAIDQSEALAIGTPGRAYPIPPEARFEPEVARALFSSGEFVFDIQGHLLEYDLDPSTRHRSFWGKQFPQAGCRDEDDPRACFTMDHFLEEVFVLSDTTMVALSGLPILPEGSPLPNELMDETRRVVEILGTDERVIVNAQALPQIAPMASFLDEMERTVADFEIRGWKTFTHFPRGAAWRLDDADPALPQVGGMFLDQVARSGSPILCIHKGLSGNAAASSPADVGPAARNHPDVKFVVYHSGYEASIAEGPYTPASANVGINRLITSLKRSDVTKGENVYAELGSTWWHLMRKPTQAAHAVGKLLLAFGENNILWGTDSIFYGSPQPQIEAFRAFEIPEWMQARYGYPALTSRMKRKILGVNAANLYDIDPVSLPLRFSQDELRQARQEHPFPAHPWGPKTSAEVAAFRDHHQGWP